MILAITYQCNSRCRMCGIWKKINPPEINLADVHKIPGNLKDINITGGEPFLCRNLIEIIKIFSAKSPRASLIISSNGFATNVIIAKMKEILKMKPDAGVAISLDGIGKAHSEIRGIENGYEKALATLFALKRLKVKKLRFSFTLGDYNCDQLKPVYELSRKLGVEMSLTLVHSGDQYFNTQNFVTQKKDLAGVLDWLIKEELSFWNVKEWLRAYYAFGMKRFVLTGKRILPDYSGRDGVFVDPDGNIFPSDISEQILGNIKNFNFSEINSMEIKENKPSWMICTARTAIRKHWFRAGMWILRNKFLSL